MFSRRSANWIRFVLGIAIALGLGIDSHFADRGAVLTIVEPGIILIVTLADLIGYLSERGK